MSLITIHKFGGTSVDRLRDVQEILEEETHIAQPVAVVSAFSGHTNTLLGIADRIMENPGLAEKPMRLLFHELLESTADKVFSDLGEEAHDPTWSAVVQNIAEYFTQMWVPNIVDFVQAERRKDQPAEQTRINIVDRIAGLGEIISHEVLARVFTLRSKLHRQYRPLLYTLNEPSIPPEHVKAFMERDNIFASIVSTIRPAIEHCLRRPNTVPIVSGYIAGVPGGILQTIDRGYTDTTAAMTAVACRQLSGAPFVTMTIHKEVPGVMSADPREVEPGYDPKKHRKEADFRVARVRGHISYRELAELSVLARMKAVNENVMYVLDGSGVSLRVKNTLDPDAHGTTVTDEGDPEHRGIRFVAGRKGQSMFTVESNRMAQQHSVAGRIFSMCGHLGIPVDAITTSATSVSFSVPGDHPEKARLHQRMTEIGNVAVRDNMALICCIGNDMADKKGLLRRVAGVLSDNDINIEFDCGNPDGNITFIIKDEDYARAVTSLHRELIEKA